ncbi:MAG: DUF6279 family lipoprotein [Pseudomonadota bacterium]
MTIRHVRVVKIRLRRWALLAGFTLLASCSMLPLAYNNADVLVRLRVQEHFDLQGSQATDFSTRLARFHQWHRAEELPQYAGLFLAAEKRVANGLTAEDVHWATQALRERYRAMMRHVAEESAPVLVTLAPAQLTHLEKEFAEDNQKFIKAQHLGESEERQLRFRIKGMRKQFDEWFGRLTPEQDAQIVAMVTASKPLGKLRLEERKQTQQRFLALLRNHRKADGLAPALRDMLENIESQRTPAFAQAMQDAELRLTQLLLDLDKTLTASQRAHVKQRFASFAVDFQTLAKKGKIPVDRSAALDWDMAW